MGKLKVTNGKLAVSRAGSSQQPRVYDKVDIEVSNFSLTNSFPFKMTASLPAGGSLKLDGNAGPIDANNAAIERGRSGEFGRRITVRELRSEVELHYLLNFSQARFAAAVNRGVEVARAWCRNNLAT